MVNEELYASQLCNFGNRNFPQVCYLEKREFYSSKDLEDSFVTNFVTHLVKKTYNILHNRVHIVAEKFYILSFSSLKTLAITLPVERTVLWS